MFDSEEVLLRLIQSRHDGGAVLRGCLFRDGRVHRPSSDELADELAAIANTRDGVLVLGVEAKTRDIIGIPIERLDAVEKHVLEVCTDVIKPPVAFHTYRLELPDSSGTPRAVLRVDVPRSLFVHRSPGGYLRRQGSSAREMPPDVLARLFQQRSQARLIRFEEQTVPDSTPAHLDERLYRRFVAPDLADAEVGLRKMRLLAEDDTGATRATVAGVLTCSLAPERWLPNAFIQAVRYRGKRQDSNYQLDALDVTGPLDVQVLGALVFVLRNMTVSARKDPARAEFPQYSARAVFEAIVNAVAHRDYSVDGSKIRLFMFDDRLELYSPGPLPNSVTLDSMALRQSTRNELLTSLLAKCPVNDPRGEIGRRFLMEKRGDGVPVIIEESRKLSGKDPAYRLIDDAELLLTIFAAEAPGTEGDPSVVGA